VEDRYNDIHEICRQHLDDHVLAFNDAHFMMACLGTGDKKSTQMFLDSMRKFIKYSKILNNMII